VKRVAALALLLLGCATAGTATPGAKTIRIDHVIVGAADLDAAIAEIERLTGVRPVIGGVHPGRGTRNALLSLGEGTYLEIVAPDPAQSVDSEDVRALRALPRPTPFGWAVSADTESALRSALSGADIAITDPKPGSRAKPDGSVLRWVTFGYATLDKPQAPFFIIWADPALHPSRTSAAGCRLSGMAIESPDAAAISHAIAPLGLRAPVKAAAEDRIRLSLSCPKGEVRL
jgi:hypothetical protein